MFRAGELTEQEIEKINDIMAKPTGNTYIVIEHRLQHSQMVLEQIEGRQGRKLYSVDF